MTTSFGKWYQDQQHASNGGVVGDERESMLPMFVTGSARDLSDSVTGGLGQLKSTFESQFPAKVCGMNYQERFRMFCVMLLLSALFFLLGFAVGLPMITFRPQKFALCFTFGSMTFMASFAILKGPYDHFVGMFHADRMLFSAVYFGSIFSTLYFTMNVGGAEGYIVVLICSAFQILALLWYLISYIPGGSSGLKVLLGALAQMVRPILVGCAKMWSRCIAALFGWATR